MFAVKLDLPNFLSNPLFNITWEKRNYITLNNGTLIKNIEYMQFEQCRPDHWNGLPSYGIDWNSAFEQGGLSTYLCPRIEDMVSFGGTYSSPPYDFIKVQVSPCANNTDSSRYWQPNCQTEDQVKKFFNKTQSVTVMFRMVNYVVNPNDPKNPIKSYIDDTLFFPVQGGTAYQTANIYLTENIVKTDQSIMPFQNIQTEQLMVFNGGNFRLQYVIGNTNKIVADFYFLKDPISYTHERQFTKVSQIASYIGGFCQTFILVAAIVVNQYNSYVCAIKIANQLYDFDLVDQAGPDQRKQYRQSSFYKVNQKKIDQEKLEKSNLPQNMVEFTNQNISKEKDLGRNQLDQQNQEEAQPKRFISHRKHQSLLKPKTREEGGLLSLDQIQKIVEGNRLDLDKNTPQNQYQSQNTQDSQQMITAQNIQAKTELNIPLQQKDYEKKLDLLSSPSEAKQVKKRQHSNEENTNQISKQQYNCKNQIEQISVIDEPIQPETPNQEKKIQFCLNSQEKEQNSQEVIDVNQINLDQQNSKKLNFSMIQLDYTKSVTTIPLKNKESLPSKQITNSYNNIMQNDKKLTQSKFDSSVRQKTLTKTTISDFKNKQEYLDEKQFLKQEFEFLASRDKSIKLSMKYMIYKLTCGKFYKTKETQLIDKAQIQMSQDLDIFTILSGIKETQKLKGLLLTQEEQILFNFFPKQVISINDNEQLPSRIQLEQKKKEITNSIKEENKKENLQVQNHSKKLNLNLRVASIVKKATTKFKQPLTNKNEENSNQKYDIDAYQKLYQAYKNILKGNKNEIEKNKERYLTKISNLQSSKRYLTHTENAIIDSNVLTSNIKNRAANQNNKKMLINSENKTNFNSYNGQLESERPFQQKLYEKSLQKQQKLENCQDQQNNDHALIVFDDPSQDYHTINNSHNKHFSQI